MIALFLWPAVAVCAALSPPATLAVLVVLLTGSVVRRRLGLSHL